MNRWDYFLFLFHQGRSFIVSNLLLICLFLLLFVVLLYNAFKVDKAPYKKLYLISLIPFLFPLLMLVWGTLFEHTQVQVTNVPAWQSSVLSGIFLLQLAINLVCLVWFKGIRLSIAVLALLQACFTFPFLLVASMSVSGIWL